MKKPSFQFYPGDWRKDQDLSRASLRAKGALIEILCLAFECEKRGVLKTGKNPWSIDEIAHAMGGDKNDNISAIEELLTKKILKKDKKNTIFSARMVRDEKLIKVRREAGSKGGNPNLVNQTPNQKPTPSSSSSSSTSVINTGTPTAEEAPYFKIFRNCVPKTMSDDLVLVEVQGFRERYPEVPANKSGPLINTWAGRIGMDHQKPDYLNPKKNNNAIV
jgi:hypothetical protein